MLNKVPKINYDACYPSRLKRIFRNDINYLTYEKFVPYSKNQTVGNIPIEIIRLFKDDKCNKIKRFQQGMANIANYLRGCYLGAKKENIISYGFSDLDDKDLKIFERQITLFANKQFKNVLPKDISVNLKYKFITKNLVESLVFPICMGVVQKQIFGHLLNMLQDIILIKLNLQNIIFLI